MTSPDADPPAFWHLACAGRWCRYLSLMFLSLIPLQGLVPLQLNFTATGVADEPLMSVYDRSLICTLELCRHTQQHSS